MMEKQSALAQVLYFSVSLSYFYFTWVIQFILLYTFTPLHLEANVVLSFANQITSYSADCILHQDLIIDQVDSANANSKSALSAQFIHRCKWMFNLLYKNVYILLDF